MISEVIFVQDCRCFAQGSTVGFIPGLNLVVGDQGCGKSTLLQQLRLLTVLKTGQKIDPRTGLIEHDLAVDASWEGPPGRFGFFDFEKDNPRNKRDLGMTAGYNGVFQLKSHFRSHGETSNSLLAMLKEPMGNDVFALDEPDTALSPRSVLKLRGIVRESLRGSNGQIIMAVHNPFLIESVSHVLSLEHGCWMSSEDFLAKQRDVSVNINFQKPRVVDAPAPEVEHEQT